MLTKKDLNQIDQRIDIRLESHIGMLMEYIDEQISKVIEIVESMNERNWSGVPPLITKVDKLEERVNFVEADGHINDKRLKALEAKLK